MEFKKYQSIENSYQEKFMERVHSTLDFYNANDMLFSVSEKVDGCNTSIITDGTSIITGQRSKALTAEDKFYGFQEFVESMKDKVFKLFAEVKKDIPEIEYIRIYGEFFGGVYKGMKSNVSMIQKGIYYSPNHEFYGFDIVTIFNDGSTKYVGVDMCNKLFEAAGIFYNKELFRGTLDECLNYNPVFISTIGPRLGLPEIEDNYAEGVVIKPIVPMFLATGDRLIIKNKNPKFNEFEKSGNFAKVKKEDVNYSDDCNRMKESICHYINEARLHNVMSHTGMTEITKEKVGMILKEFSFDILEDFKKDYPEFDNLDVKEQRAVTKTMNAAAMAIIKTKY